MNLNYVINALLRTPYAHTYQNEYVYVRCPMCGDSLKHKDKCHCSIWCKPGQPLIYHCWICEESGVVNTNFLQSMGINDLSISNNLEQYNKATSKGKKITTFNKAKLNFDLTIPTIEDTELNRVKLNYMKDRMGINFTYKSMEYLRTVFSINDFIKLNGLSIPEKYRKQFYFLDRDYIGFLSSSKEVLILRAINNKNKIRYIKYSVFEGNDSPEQMYTIPSTADIFSDTVNLNITEGTFDILGIFFNVKKCKIDNEIYAAVGGSAYKRVIQNMLKKGFISNLVVNIYSDQDKEPEFYERLITEYNPWVKDWHIYYNTKEGEKDFGVSKDRIQLKEIKIRGV